MLTAPARSPSRKRLPRLRRGGTGQVGENESPTGSPPLEDAPRKGRGICEGLRPYSTFLLVVGTDLSGFRKT